MNSYCPMIKDDCEGTRCILWGDALMSGCDLSNAYQSIPSINYNLSKLVEQIKEAELDQISVTIYQLRGAVAELMMAFQHAPSAEDAGE